MCNLQLRVDNFYLILFAGGSEFLGTEFFDSLLKLAPTKEEEFLLRHYKGEVTRLNAGERFLKAMLNVPFSMKRIDVMLYRARLETDIDYLKKSFQTLQVNSISPEVRQFLLSEDYSMFVTINATS